MSDTELIELEVAELRRAARRQIGLLLALPTRSAGALQRARAQTLRQLAWLKAELESHRTVSLALDVERSAHE